MKTRALTKSGIIFLLLLIYIQQMGAGLFVHNLVHDNKGDQVPFEQNDNGREINFACKCIDDFLMPLVAGDELPALPTPKNYAKPPDTYSESNYFISLIITSLRGPPVFIG